LPRERRSSSGLNTYRETFANDAKRMFVCANLLSALIRAGEVKNDQASLWNATQLLGWLRGLVPFVRSATSDAS
jgi:hypothetical protein